MDNYSKTGAYWDREKSPNGRKINDALDKHEENVAWTGVARGTERQREAFYELRREVSHEKAVWRREFHETGILVTPQERWDRYEEAERSRLEAQYSRGPAGEQVRGVKSTEWRMSMDGRTEAQVHIGQSNNGFHYSVSSTDNRTYESDPAWSKAFKTMAVAERVAHVEQNRLMGELWGSQQRSPMREARRVAAAFSGDLPKTERALVAHDLNQAASNRQAGDLFTARGYVDQARQDRVLNPRPDIGLSR